MPKIKYAGETIECESGEKLRDVLRRGSHSNYNGAAKLINCRGNGLCGMCAVQIRGTASWPMGHEARRLRLLRNATQAGLRLACQFTVQGDMNVEKFEGLFGNRLEQPKKYCRKSHSNETIAQQV